MEKEFIPYGRQDIDQDDVDAVVSVLNSDFLTQGPWVSKFEKAVAAHVGVNFGVAVNSATSALHLSCLALGLEQGDFLWTTPISFVASANCALYCGASVDFVDIDPRTYNICAVALEKKLLLAEQLGRLPKILVVVHLCGQSADMEVIHMLALRFRFKVIEDASHAIGGKYKRQFIGNCRFSDITVFSFHPVKIITTAEGGIALTNDALVASQLDLLRSHGITRSVDRMDGDSDGPWYYQQIDLGFNYRMTELQAALGVSQLKRLDSFVARRHLLAKRYDDLLKGFPLDTPFQLAECYSSFHLYVIRLRLDFIKKTRLQVFEELRSAGIGVNVHYIPIHTQPFYRAKGFAKGDFPVAEKYYDNAISLPMFHSMTFEQQDYIVSSLAKVLFE